MSSPLNTSADPLMNHLGALDAQMRTGNSSNFILEQEAAGQRQLVESEVLPTDLNGGKKEDYIALGFEFGEVVSSDPMFQKAKLPDGWKKKGSGHDMWSSIVDDKGRERVAIFYKAAFYDRSAHMNINSGNFD